MTRSCDMHVHTVYSHDCSTPLLALKHLARKHDLIVAITDHNQIGGSLAASALGMDVIPAIEVTTKRLKDFLVYFHDQDNLIDFYDRYVRPAKDPGIIWGSRTTLSEHELLDAARHYDSMVSLAHPYCPVPKRSAHLPLDMLERLDGIEVMNFAMSPRANLRAATLCDDLRKIHTAGSDSHHPDTFGMVLTRADGETPSEFLSNVRKGNSMIVGMPRRTRDVVDKVRQFVSYKMSN